MRAVNATSRLNVDCGAEEPTNPPRRWSIYRRIPWRRESLPPSAQRVGSQTINQCYWATDDVIMISRLQVDQRWPAIRTLVIHPTVDCSEKLAFTVLLSL